MGILLFFKECQFSFFISLILFRIWDWWPCKTIGVHCGVRVRLSKLIFLRYFFKFSFLWMSADPSTACLKEPGCFRYYDELECCLVSSIWLKSRDLFAWPKSFLECHQRWHPPCKPTRNSSYPFRIGIKRYCAKRASYNFFLLYIFQNQSFYSSSNQ